ncbi:3' terminal RNA ribose 2'-O-methyltransferase Hen1, partial [bacterium (Candidatus Blackallbacteria) CG17_big_fil_post_rev_8_21_14_2_50_48_46]
MLLTLTTTHAPATDLGYLMHKNPARVQHFDVSFGQVHVFYPEVSEERCTLALVLDIDPIGQVREHNPAWEGFALGQYVNDRPYVASSFMSVAIAQVLGSALNGRCREKPLLADLPIPLTAKLSVVASRGGPGLLEALFAPLGYQLTITRHPLEPRFPEWGESPYYTLELSHTLHLSALLTHLYVLLPVLDNDKHYFIGPEEVEKLLKRGEGWLSAHPACELITRRYLRHQKRLTDLALQRLQEEPMAFEGQKKQSQEEALEQPLSLNQRRLERVAEVIAQSGVASAADLGCGEGQLLQLLWQQASLKKIIGMDVSSRSLEKASRRLHTERFSEKQQERLALFQGSLVYRDRRLQGVEAVVAVEVMEHLEPFRLEAFTQVIFEDLQPEYVVLTTPNAEYNALFPLLPAGSFRHSDHRFEWSRAEFEAWCLDIARKRHYRLRFEPIGPCDEVLGAPTQTVVQNESSSHLESRDSGCDLSFLTQERSPHD